MPQHRRKVAFSTKQKKEQLKQRKARKQSACNDGNGSSHKVLSGAGSKDIQYPDIDVEVVNKQPVKSGKQDPNRYRLMFKKENADALKERTLEAQKALEFLPEEKLEVSYKEVFAPGSELDMPKRPPWNSSMTKNVLEAREEKYFREYIAALETRFKDDLSHFDMNLETWRQLWRVLEFSDIVLLVTDIRYPIFHFSPALYDYVVKEMKKDMIVVFNKIDLVEPHVIIAWKDYFQAHFPEIRVMYFASFAGFKIKEGSKGRRIGKLRMAIDGSRYLWKMCEEIVKGQVNLSNWYKKIEEEAAEMGLDVGDDDNDYYDMENEEGDSKKRGKTYYQTKMDTSCYQEARYKDEVLTLGFVGHPNVGKSSFLNAVMGKKVVSVSRTPGHTKHYQTIMLTPTVRLCDCPGLVFPSLIPKQMQVLMGCYPIAQLREPYSAVSYLCQRVPVHKIFKLQHPNFDVKHPNEVYEWSAFDVCEALAKKRGFISSKSGRANTYRAANNILRMALDGRTICLCFYPPSFFKNKNHWIEHPDVKQVSSVQAMKLEANQEFAVKKPPYQEDRETESLESSENGSEEESDSSNEKGVSQVTNKFSLLTEVS